MRKITLTLSLLVAFGWASAQQLTSGKIDVTGKETQEISAEKLASLSKSTKSIIAQRNANQKTIKSRWYGTAFAIDDLLGNIATLSANYVFPDSTMLVNYSSGYAGTWIHSLGETIDPLSDWFDPAPGSNDLDINENMPYTVDSIGFYCLYLRESASTVIDTLIIQVETDETNYYSWRLPASQWVFDNFGVDTLAFRPVRHDVLSTYNSVPGVITIKVPLTEALSNDTLSNGLNYIKIAPPTTVQVGAGAQAIFSFTFKPGYTWTPNVDTMINHNRLRFLSYEENGDAGGAGTFPSYTKWDWNCSSILPTGWLFDATGAAIQAPSYAYTAGFAYEHHWVEFLLTANEDAIETSEQGNLKVNQNRPNPFNGTTTIDYTLANSADVMVEVYNVAGAKVMSINNGEQTAGQHTMTIDGSNLQAGVYYYTFTADGNRITKKMIVY